MTEVIMRDVRGPIASLCSTAGEVSGIRALSATDLAWCTT